MFEVVEEIRNSDLVIAIRSQSIWSKVIHVYLLVFFNHFKSEKVF